MIWTFWLALKSIKSWKYLGNTGDHVVNVRAESSDTGNLFALGEPAVNAEGVLANELELEVEVLELAAQGATGALNTHTAGIDLNLDTLGDGHVGSG